MDVEPKLTSPERERQLAATRVGQTALARMQWILDFIQQDDESLSEGELLNQRHEILACLQKPLRWRRDAKFWRWSGPLPGLPTVDHLRKLRTEWRATIEKMLSVPPGGELPVPLPMLLVYRPGERLFMRSNAPVGQGAGVQLVMSLVEDFARTIRRCEDCHRLYVAVRHRQRFCSRRCQNRVFIREKRKAPATGSSPKKVRPRRRAGATRRTATRA